MKNETHNTFTVSATDMESHIGNASLGAQEAPGLDTPCRIHLHSRRYRLTDASGCSDKAVIDGIVHAGLLPDDSPKYVESVTHSQEKIKKPEIEETIITIEPANLFMGQPERWQPSGPIRQGPRNRPIEDLSHTIDFNDGMDD